MINYNDVSIIPFGFFFFFGPVVERHRGQHTHWRLWCARDLQSRSSQTYS